MPNESGAPAAAATTDASAAATQGSAGATQESQGNSGAKTPNPAAAAKPAQAKVFEVKINGKVQRFTEEQMIARVSQEEAADQRFKEAAQMRKQNEALLGRFKDPNKAIEALMDPALGLSKDQIREAFEGWYAKEFLETENLSPAEKRAREAEAKLKKYEEDEKGREEQKRKDEQEAMTSKAREEVQGQIIEALESSDLPKTNFTIRRLAYWIQRNNANKFDAPTSVLVAQVRNEFNSSMRDMVAASDGETLIKLLGEDLVQKLRKYDLEQLRKTRGGGTPPPADTGGSPPAQKNERAPTSAEVTARIRELQKTGRY